MRTAIPWTITALSIATMFYFIISQETAQDLERGGYMLSNYSNQPINTMKRQEVMNMVSNYYSNQYTALHDLNSRTKLVLPPTQGQDSRAVFFNLDSIKRLIYYMEKASKGYSKLEKDNLGLNVYFASYPDKEPYVFKNGVNYSNRHTLVFIPSIFDTTEHIARDIDIFANLVGTLPKTNPIQIRDTFYTNNMAGRGVAAIGGDMKSQNNGTATPPPPTPTGNPLLDITDPN